MSANNKRKDWHEYVDKMARYKRNSPKDIIEAIQSKYPDVNKTTLCNYISQVRAKQRESRGGAHGGYSCPKCHAQVTKITRQEYLDDHGIRARVCECGYSWDTIEIDLDMYISIMGGKMH